MAHTSLLVLALFVVGCQSWKLPAIPAGRRAQFYTQQSDGAYKFGYDSAEGLFQVQEADPANEVHGKFGADGGHLEYTAGVDGFVVKSHKKATASQTRQAYRKPAVVRYATLEELVTPPKPVKDTAEVAEAKRQFEAAYKAAAAAAEAAPDVNIITGALPIEPAALYVAPAAPSQPVYTAPQPAVTIVKTSRPVEIAQIRSSQAADGSYQFSYTTRDSSRHESADASNNVHGNFEFVADDAQRRRVDYKAGSETGFVARGAHLPVSVSDTAEVAAAKASFKSAFEAAAAAAEAAPDDDIIPSPVIVPAPITKYSVPQIRNTYLAPEPVVFTAPKPVEDTVEVKQAKQAFKAAYDAAAAAAEAAPDVNIISGPAPVFSNTYSYSVPHVQTSYIVPAAPAVFVAPGPVEDTAEVKAAKQAFKAAYNAAAAAAEAAPDTDIITAPAGSSVRAVSSHHAGDRSITYTLDGGVMVMQADGFSAPSKFGYTYE